MKLELTNSKFPVVSVFALLVLSSFAIAGEQSVWERNTYTFTIDLDYNNNVMKITTVQKNHCPGGVTVQTVIPPFGQKTKWIKVKCGPRNLEIQVTMDAKNQGVSGIRIIFPGNKLPQEGYPKSKPKASENPDLSSSPTPTVIIE